jgi:carbon-monoxide dehydrogenase medium subunit
MAATEWQDYVMARTLDEAAEILASHAGRARIIAGGTDLVIQKESGRCDNEIMVDITRIPGLDFLEERDGWIWIGPQVTHAQVAASPLIREKAGPLAQACDSVGGPQIRRVATLVGNVVNAMPAADGAVALFSLDAELEVMHGGGRQWSPIAELYAGVGQCRANPCFQIVTAIRFPALREGAGWAYKRLSQRRALILPVLTTAIVVRLEGERFAEARIAVGPVAPTPFRAREAEDLLQGALVDEGVISEAARLAQEAANPRNSILRGSREYRKAMVEVLVRRGLTEAVDRARAE